MKKTGFLLGLLVIGSLASCARRACPAYDSQLIKKQPTSVYSA